MLQKKQVEFSFKGKTYKMGEITLARYYDVRKEALHDDPRDSMFRMVEAVSGCPSRELRRMKPFEFAQVWTEFEKKFNTSKEKPFHQKIKIKGVDYGFNHLDDMGIGEWADLMYLSNKPDYETNLHTVLSILYRPIVREGNTKYWVEEYKFDECNDRAKLFLDVDYEVVLGATNFFFHVSRTSYQSILSSFRRSKEPLAMEMAEKLDQMLTALLEAGVTSSSSLQETILLRSKELRDLALSSLSQSTREPRTRREKLRKLWDRYATNLTRA